MNQIYLQSSQHPPLLQSSEVKSVECEAVSFQLSTNTFQLPPLLHTNPAARVPSVKPTKLAVNDPGSLPSHLQPMFLVLPPSRVSRKPTPLLDKRLDII